MRITIERVDRRHARARLREGDVETEVTGWDYDQSVAALRAAFETAAREGYGECFWAEPTGQYWWLLKRVDQRLEVVVLWSDSPGRGWQHVFRAADEVEYLTASVGGRACFPQFSTDRGQASGG